MGILTKGRGEMVEGEKQVAVVVVIVVVVMVDM